MKKILLTLTLLCVALTLHALDYRQVIFGNSYENIIEINADDFFEQYPEVKEHCKPDYFRSFSEHEREEIEALPNYYRVYEQVIGDDTFFRLLISFDRYSDVDLLNWKDIFFTQYVFYKESEKKFLQLDDMYLFGKENIAMDSQYVYEGLEIIERNSTVIGLLRHKLEDSFEADLSYNGPRLNRCYAYYCLWEEGIKSHVQKTDNIYYIGWENNDFDNTYTTESFWITLETEKIGELPESPTTVLVDRTRPFMYTIQNAFDGNPTTSYVEDTATDKFSISINRSASAFLIINGYADGEYYKENNQIKKISLVNYDEPSKHYFLKASLLPQEYSIMPQKYGFEIEVSEITPGTKYNDTTLAELDIYIDGEGWLFGGLE